MDHSSHNFPLFHCLPAFGLFRRDLAHFVRIVVAVDLERSNFAVAVVVAAAFVAPLLAFEGGEHRLFYHGLP